MDPVFNLLYNGIKLAPISSHGNIIKVAPISSHTPHSPQFVYVNVYPCGILGDQFYETEEAAGLAALDGPRPIACAKLTRASTTKSPV